jgi:hypothetical protein
MNFCGFSHFPPDLLGVLGKYFLFPDDEDDGPRFKFSLEFRNLVNSNCKYFSEWKRQTQILSLNDKYSLLFIQSKSFHDIVTRSISTLKQLEVSLEMGGLSEIDFSLLNGMKKVSFVNWIFPSAPLLIDVDHVVLRGDLQDLSFCANVRKLELRHWSRDFQRIGPAIDLGCLTNVEELKCDAREVQNYTNLSHLKTARFLSCRSIEDVSCFQNCQKLVLNDCGNVADVSSLKNVVHLDLTRCEKVEDVSSLDRVHTLVLYGCNEIRYVSSLGRVHSLDLSGCNSIGDISPLGSVHSLKLCGYGGKDISCLMNVTELNLSYSSSLSDLSEC